MIALKHIRSVAQEKESIYACYVMEPGTGRLLGAVSLRDLVMESVGTCIPLTVDRADSSTGPMVNPGSVFVSWPAACIPSANAL